MDRQRTFSGFTALAVALFFVLGACTQSGTTGSEQKVTALETRVAALETRVIAQQSQLGALQTVGARQATPTPIPPVAGLPVNGATRGLASARVTLTEYADFL